MNRFFILLFASFIFLACNKDAVIEDDIDNNELGLVHLDTFKINSKTILDKVINGNNISIALLGQTNDSRVGESKASFYTQFSLTKNSFNLGNNPVLDSVVLIFKQTDSYGDLNSTFDINVYELENEIADISYKNNSVLNVKPNTLASISNYKFSKNEGSIRIPMNTTFSNKLFSFFGTEALESSDKFKESFKGMYVTTNTINGDGFVYINLHNDETALKMYYHNDEVADTSYSFIVETKDNTINQYLHDISNSEIENIIDQENESIAFVGSMSSYKTEIEMPDLSNLNGIVINKATLTVFQEDFGEAISISFEEPDKMILLQNLQDTSVAFLNGYSLSKVGPVGGSEKTTLNGTNTVKYTFKITDYIQSLVKGNAKSNSLYIKTLGNNEGNRIKISGGNNTNSPIKLDIIYTKIN